MENWRPDPNSSNMPREDRAATIKALLKERWGYEVRGLKDRIAEVDRVLRRLGHEAEKPVARAEKRPTPRRGRR